MSLEPHSIELVIGITVMPLKKIDEIQLLSYLLTWAVRLIDFKSDLIVKLMIQERKILMIFLLHASRLFCTSCESFALDSFIVVQDDTKKGFGEGQFRLSLYPQGGYICVWSSSFHFIPKLMNFIFAFEELQNSEAR